MTRQKLIYTSKQINKQRVLDITNSSERDQVVGLVKYQTKWKGKTYKFLETLVCHDEKLCHTINRNNLCQSISKQIDVFQNCAFKLLN